MDNNIQNNMQNNMQTGSSPYTGTPYNQQTYNMQYWQKKVVESPEVLDFREKIGRKLGNATLIFALISTICLYKNLAGVTMPLFAVSTLIYMIYGLKQYNVAVKKFSVFYAFCILALSVSDFLTGNFAILFFNNISIFVLLILFLLHNVYDDSRWNFTKTTLAFFESLISSVVSLEDLAKDMHVLRQRSKSADNTGGKKKPLKYVIIGLLISVPVVAVILALLSAADAVFNIFLTKYLQIDLKFSAVLRVAVTFVIIFLVSYCIMRFFSSKRINEEVKSKRNLEPIIAITILSIISVIYLLFSVIQIVYLFWGGVKLPENYTYAQYAREGFFQLLAVSIINFLMVLFINNHFRESRALKILMTIISLCTYIMIASSCMRMLLYIDVYLLTSLRIWVLWGLAVLSLLFIAVIISIFKNSFPLFRYSIIVVSIMYLLIGFAHTDYVIADYNLTHVSSYTVNGDEKEKNSRHHVTDHEYLSELSTDAAPVIAKQDGEWVSEYFGNCSYFYENRGIRNFNLSAYRAKKLSDGK